MAKNPQQRLKVPLVPEDLVEWLDDLFDGRVGPEPTDPSDYFIKVGHRQVIARLKTELKRQHNY